jgi:glycosyltransferase involved in cell wall biosynthesis
MPEITLSYVLTTFNKITFLKVVVNELIQNRKDDEEIIVIDGGSADGTPEYLCDLKAKGDIDFYLSEKDKGESHGFNKGFFKAKGDLIKVITDDDAFYYPVIQKCKDYMLHNPGIDIMAGNMGSINMEDINSLYWSSSFQDDFKKWKEGSLKNFFFNGTCLMIRKSSLNLTGLFNTRSLLADMEFTLRVTGVADIAWCTGIISTRILNSQSNNVKFADKARIEDEKLCMFYEYKHAHVRKQDELRKRSAYRKIRSYLAGVKSSLFNKRKDLKDISAGDNNVYTFKEIHDHCIIWMAGHDLNNEISFLTR